jgi:hypothetical protein
MGLFSWLREPIKMYRAVPDISASGHHGWSIEKAHYSMAGCHWITYPAPVFATKAEAEAAVRHLEGE